MIEFKLAELDDARHLLLRLDCGQGFDPALSLTLPLRRGKVAKRICYFPARVRALQLEVVFAKGEAGDDTAAHNLEVAHCCLAWLAPHFARERLCQRLANMHRNFRGMPLHAVRRVLARDSREKGRSWRALALSYYGETFHRRCPDTGYGEWLAQVEPELLPRDVEVTAFLTSEVKHPEFLLYLQLTPDCAESALQAVQSLVAQSYPHWRLFVSDCSSLEGRSNLTVDHLDALLREEERISRVEDTSSFSQCLRFSHPGVCFVSKLPTTGRLGQHALYSLAVAASEHEDAQLLYPDSDSLNPDGTREAPLFKPRWNPDLLLAYNYVGPFCFFRRELLQQMDSVMADMDSDVPYAALLHCRDELTADQVVHVPRVLYHQQFLSETHCTTTRDRERCALETYLQTRSLLLDCWQNPAGAGLPVAHCRWPLPETAPLVSLLVPTRDGVDLLRQCVNSILQKTDYPNFEILILDNQSRCRETLAYLEAVQSDARVRVHRWDRPFNYSAINNFGAGLARGSILGLINNDVEVISSGWLREMVSHACRPEIGCVGAKLYYGNDTLQHGGVILGIGGTAGHSHRCALRDSAGYMARLQVVQNLSAVTGACLLLRKSVFEEVGGLNEVDLAIAYNDVDLCLKVREAGYRNLWTPHAELYHHESVSRGADDTAAKRQRAQREADYMRRRWGKLLDSDPAYNPNLTLIYEDFSLA